MEPFFKTQKLNEKKKRCVIFDKERENYIKLKIEQKECSINIK